MAACSSARSCNMPLEMISSRNPPRRTLRRGLFPSTSLSRLSLVSNPVTTPSPPHLSYTPTRFTLPLSSSNTSQSRLTPFNLAGSTVLVPTSCSTSSMRRTRRLHLSFRTARTRNPPASLTRHTLSRVLVLHINRVQSSRLRFTSVVQRSDCRRTPRARSS